MSGIERDATSPCQRGLAQMRANASVRDVVNDPTPGTADFHAWLEPPMSNKVSAPSVPVAEAALDHTLAIAVATASTADPAAGLVYPWTLQAQAYLSQIGGLRGGGDARSQLADTPISLQGGGLDGDLLASTSSAALTPPLAPASDPVLGPTIAMRTGGIGHRSEKPDPSIADAPGKAIAASWSERLLRRTSDVQGNTTWWLRDYRLSEAEREALTHALLSQAPGQRPHRIVVNGVEVWRAPHLLQES